MIEDTIVAHAQKLARSTDAELVKKTDYPYLPVEPIEDGVDCFLSGKKPEEKKKPLDLQDIKIRYQLLRIQTNFILWMTCRALSKPYHKSEAIRKLEEQYPNF